MVLEQHLATASLAWIKTSSPMSKSSLANWVWMSSFSLSWTTAVFGAIVTKKLCSNFPGLEVPWFMLVLAGSFCIVFLLVRRYPSWSAFLISISLTPHKALQWNSSSSWGVEDICCSEWVTIVGSVINLTFWWVCVYACVYPEARN